MDTHINNPSSSNGPGTGNYQQNLPNSVAVLVTGICSIFPGCFCMGVVGVVCGIVALVLARKDMRLYNSNPGAYTLSSFNNLNAGRVCAIIGLSISSLILLFYVITVVLIGMTAVTFFPWSSWK
jgi:hypothetical protein